MGWNQKVEKYVIASSNQVIIKTSAQRLDFTVSYESNEKEFPSRPPLCFCFSGSLTGI